MAAQKRKPDATPTPLPTAVPTPEPRFIGVDLHKRIAEYHILNARGESIRRGKFPVTAEAIAEFADKHLCKTDYVAVEATSNTWAFVRLIRDHVADIVVSNPLKTKAIAEASIKTDKVDALVLAQLLRCDYLPSVWQPGPAVEQSRGLAARRTSLVNNRTAIRNRVHSVLAQRLITEPASDPFSVKWLAWLGSITLDPAARAAIDADLRLLAALQVEIKAVEHMIDGEAFADPRVQLLMTLPGVDCAVAQTLMAALGDIDRFPTPDQAAGYLGLVPRIKQSADKSYTGPITKAGSSQARWMLVQAAQSVGRHPGPLGAFFRKLARRKNRNVAVVATGASWSQSLGICSRIMNLTAMRPPDVPTRSSRRCVCGRPGRSESRAAPRGPNPSPSWAPARLERSSPSTRFTSVRVCPPGRRSAKARNERSAPPGVKRS